MYAKIFDDSDTLVGQVDGSGVIDYSALVENAVDNKIGVENLPKLFSGLRLLGAVAQSIKKAVPQSSPPIGVVLTSD